MNKTFQWIVATLLLLTNFMQLAMAALPNNASTLSYLNGAYSPNNLQNSTNAYPIVPVPSNLVFSTEQFGLSGPLTAALSYSDLTGTFVSGQYLKQLADKLAIGVLGEYGDKQYRLNGTLGFFLDEQSLFKFSVERFNQKLPFSFDSGSIKQRVGQDAFGARYQKYLGYSLLNNMSLGAYYAKAGNVALDSLSFTSNGSNCLSLEAGLHCVNERNIAGGTSAGADIGLGIFLTSQTALEGRLYYDTLRYNTIFTYGSSYDRDGFGGAVFAHQLLTSNLKFSAGAEVRKIYNTYNLALSWIPPLSASTSGELALTAQRVISHNQTPDNDIVGLQFTLLTDRTNYENRAYYLARQPSLRDISVWVKQPAVKMNQVLAIAEQFTHLVAPLIFSIIPNTGPLVGGNVVTINGNNFPSNILVHFGEQVAVVTSVTSSVLTVIAPAVTTAGSVDVTLTTPDNQSTNFEDAYLYSDSAAPFLFSITPSLGNINGVIEAVISGSGFIPGSTTLIIDGTIVAPNVVTPTSITLNLPPHIPGIVNITVNTLNGSASLGGGFTYIAVPTVGVLTPAGGPISGLTNVVLSGTGFVPGNTIVNIDGQTIIPTTLTSTSLSFTAPAHGAGTVAVSVTTSAGTSTNVSGGFTYVAGPTATVLSPAIVNENGMTGLTLTGSGFVIGGTTVNVDGVAIIPTALTPTSLSFDAPPHATGNVVVSVTTSVSTSANVSGGLTYVAAPTVGLLSPAAGPVIGTTGVVLNGSGFVVGHTTVNFGGSPIIPSIVTPTSITFDAPAHAAGTVSVSVTTPAGTSANVSGGFTYVAAPTVGILTLALISVAGQNSLALTGTAFVVGNTLVNVDGMAITPTSITPTSLTFNAPPHAAGTVVVNVTTPVGSSADVAGGLTYAAVPTVMALTPSLGPLTGTLNVNLTGTGFISGSTTVNVDGSPIIPTTVTATSLSCNMPAHAAGTVTVNVTTPGGSSANVSGGFSYIAPPIAASLSHAIVNITGMTGLVLTGSGFVIGGTTVNIDGIPLVPTAVTSTTITFDAPAHAAGTVSVNVTTPVGTSGDLSGGLTYIAAPTVSILSPAVGPLTGSSNVSLMGTGFVAGNTLVNVDSLAIIPTAITATTLTFDLPAHAVGTVSVDVTTPAGTSANVGGGFTYVAPPTVAMITPAIIPITGQTGLTLTGRAFVAGNTVVNVDGVMETPRLVNTTSLSFEAPAHAAGNVVVNVTTPVGSSANVSGGLTYVAAPIVANLTPALGPLSGTVGVTLTGSNFINANTTVNLDGSLITPTLVTPTSLTFNAPAHAAGTVALNVSTPGGTSANVSGGFTYAASPTVNDLTPVTANIAGAVGVVLTGSNFIPGNTTVNIGGAVALPTSITANSLIFDAPAHVAGTVVVSITTPGGTSANLAGGFTYINTPTVTNLSVAVGNTSGVVGVVLNGTGFIPGSTTINFDGSPIIPTFVTATSITFDAPPHAVGTVNLNVTTPAGTSTNVSGGFTYTAAPTVAQLTPAIVPVAGLTGVTLSGSGFVVGATTVSVDGVVIIPTLITTTLLTFDVPAHAAANVVVNVSTVGGTSANVSGGLSYAAVPVATALTPSASPISGFAEVVLTGSEFIVGNTIVNFDGNPLTPTLVTPTSLTFNAPAHAVGTVAVSVTTPGGTSTNMSGGFSYVNAPTVGALAPIAGPLTGVNGVVLSGTGFVAANTTVNFDGNPITPTAVTATSLTFDAPAHAAGTVTVSITTPAGTSANVSGGFTYTAMPTVGSLTPAIIPLNGLNGITLSGTGFIAGVTTVTVDGGTIIPTAITPTLITFDAPAHAAGVVTVNVDTPGGTSANVSPGLSYAAAPTISLFTPGAAPLTGLDGVVLSGTGFIAGNTMINFDGSPITPTLVTPTTLTFNAPAHAAGVVAVSITTPVGTSANLSGGFTYVNAPTVDILTPIAAPLAGLTGIVLSGTGFVAGNTTLNFDGSPITPISVSPTSLIFDAPAHSAGTVIVSVTSPAGTSANVSGGFTYANTPIVGILTPGAAPLTGLGGISLAGSNFIAGATTVNLDGMALIPSLITPTQLIFNAPAHTVGIVDLSVSTPAGTSANVSGGFTYVAAPTADSINPVAVPLTGLIGVSLTGSGFVANNTIVNVDGLPITPTSVAANLLTFTAPAHAAATVTVNVTTPAGTSANLSDGLTFTEAPTVSLVDPIAAPATGLSGIILTGTGFVPGSTTVNLDGIVITPSVVTATSLTFNVPAHAAGTVAINVTTPVGSSANVSGGFSYVLAPTVGGLVPTTSPLSGLVGLTLSGTGFVRGSTTVNVDGVAVVPTAVTPSSLTFNAPAHVANTVSVNVTTVAGTSGNVSGGLTYLATPTVGVLTPSQGSTSGANGVTLSGTGFVPGSTTVNIGGNIVVPTAATTTLLTFDAPAHVAGTVGVNASTSVGTSANVTSGFNYAATPMIASCSYTGGLFSSAWLCTGVNMNAFPNTYINIQGGLSCTLGVGISLLTTTIKTALSLGGNTVLPNLYSGCSINLCNNSKCTGLRSNIVTVL